MKAADQMPVPKEAQEEKGVVSPEQYGAAVNQLVALALQETSGGRAAAQVLLSAYNGYEWQRDITDLAIFDQTNFEAAMTVIRGRRDTYIEPQRLIPEGDRIFGDLLWNKWIRLHVKERGKMDCPSCDGRGRIYRGEDDEGETCTSCEGSGRVCNCSR